MEKIIVPKDKCPIVELVKRCGELKNTWIFVNDDVLDFLQKAAFYWGYDGGHKNYSIHKTEQCPARNIRMDLNIIENWSICYDIMLDCTTVVYKRPENCIPDKVVFVEMEK